MLCYTQYILVGEFVLCAVLKKSIRNKKSSFNECQINTYEVSFLSSLEHRITHFKPSIKGEKYGLISLTVSS